MCKLKSSQQQKMNILLYSQRYQEYKNCVFMRKKVSIIINNNTKKKNPFSIFCAECGLVEKPRKDKIRYINPTKHEPTERPKIRRFLFPKHHNFDDFLFGQLVKLFHFFLFSIIYEIEVRHTH